MNKVIHRSSLQDIKAIRRFRSFMRIYVKEARYLNSFAKGSCFHVAYFIPQNSVGILYSWDLGNSSITLDGDNDGILSEVGTRVLSHLYYYKSIYEAMRREKERPETLARMERELFEEDEGRPMPLKDFEEVVRECWEDSLKSRRRKRNSDPF